MYFHYGAKAKRNTLCDMGLLTPRALAKIQPHVAAVATSQLTSTILADKRWFLGPQANTRLCHQDSHCPRKSSYTPRRRLPLLQAFAEKQNSNCTHCSQMPIRKQERKKHPCPTGADAPSCVGDAITTCIYVCRSSECSELGVPMASIQATLLCR